MTSIAWCAWASFAHVSRLRRPTSMLKLPFDPCRCLISLRPLAADTEALSVCLVLIFSAARLISCWMMCFPRPPTHPLLACSRPSSHRMHLHVPTVARNGCRPSLRPTWKSASEWAAASLDARGRQTRPTSMVVVPVMEVGPVVLVPGHRAETAAAVGRINQVQLAQSQMTHMTPVTNTGGVAAQAV